ncbi:NEDD4 family-interacting protein 1-like [Perognathus longimembris pacificus]|uniref:NEDD4 family-interacting protein 1-like n=1 Tax=Perognathus longimembris pacificus TaxID=214514 RepID=UPI0020189978|nr:NEDD4 family-interacting protein 1-like [Perognathus longimembris pacificus]
MKTKSLILGRELGTGRPTASWPWSPPPPQGPRWSLGGDGADDLRRASLSLPERRRPPRPHARRDPRGPRARPGRSAAPASLRPVPARSLPAAGCTVALALAALAEVEPAWGSRYQQLQNGDEPGEPEQAAGDAPPPSGSISAESAVYFDYKDESGFPKPPSYNVATTLPSYDEAERTKAEALIPLVPGRDEDFVGRDDCDDADQLRIGNDGIFMLTFFMAFLFNWIGFFLSFCLTTSAAGRCGAISGFGLSLIKWILIVRFSTYSPGYFDDQYWLWWVFLVLGFLLFLRGFISYAKVRKMPETFSNLPRTRVLFIY